jgi:RNA polymerase sigma-70 factor, ECF subfamily
LAGLAHPMGSEEAAMVPSSERALQLARGPLPDDEIVGRVLEGDTPLFEVLMRRYNQRVYRTVRGLVSDSEAEDAMQQAWLAAFSHLREFRSESRFPTWLTRIALNEAVGRARRGKRLVPLDEQQEEALPMTAHPEADAGRRELLRFAEQAVEGLPEIYRVVVLLREVEGMDTAQVAQALDVTEFVVKTRLHRARELLRAKVEDQVGQTMAETFAFEAPRCNRVVAFVLAMIEAPQAG